MIYFDFITSKSVFYVRIVSKCSLYLLCPFLL